MANSSLSGQIIQMSNSSWIGVDLDGTLAEYDGWQGIEHIGNPILPMVNYVKELIGEGINIKIFTARAAHGRKAIGPIKRWVKKYIGMSLPVTCKKDFGMVALFDDRAYTVEPNKGRFLAMPPENLVANIKWHNDPRNPNSPEYDPNKSI